VGVTYRMADALLAAGVFRDEAEVKAEAAAEALHMAADELDATARGWKTPALKDIPEDWDAHHLTVRNASEIALTNAARAIRSGPQASREEQPVSDWKISLESVDRDIHLLGVVANAQEAWSRLTRPARVAVEAAYPDGAVKAHANTKRALWKHGFIDYDERAD